MAWWKKDEYDGKVAEWQELTTPEVISALALPFPLF
jgi:hypothetical protein